MSPEVCEIDLSLAIPGAIDYDNKDDNNDSSDQSVKNKNEKENFFSKDKSKQSNTSSFNSQSNVKVLQKGVDTNIKSLKDVSKPFTQKVQNVELDNLRKQFDKLKGQ